MARAGITSARQLAGAPVAAPPGTSQVVALEYWLRQNSVAGPGPGSTGQPVPYLAAAMKAGRLAAAWEPAPADAQLAAASGGHVLFDEASLWPGGQFSAAVLVVTSRFLAGHAAAVALLLRGHIQAEQFLAADPSAALRAITARLTVAGAGFQPGAVYR